MKKIFYILVILGIIFLAIYLYNKNHTAGNVTNNAKTSTEASNTTPTPTKTPKKEVALVAVGDIMLSRDVERKINAKGTDYPYIETVDLLKQGQIEFGNLETPIISGPQVGVDSMIFRADQKSLEGLKNAGFSIVSLANNHTMNYGQKGIMDTFKYLDESGIRYVGAGENINKARNPVYIEKDGTKFAFLAYTDTDVVPESYAASENRAGVNFMNLNNLSEDITKAKKDADFVIVSMHAGTEYTDHPNERQIEFAHAAIDAGTELVIGHHPHVVQNTEIYKNKNIIYSLGNFVFDQMWSQKTREGAVAKILFAEEGVKSMNFTPILIYDYCQPRILPDGSQKNNILERLKAQGT